MSPARKKTNGHLRGVAKKSRRKAASAEVKKRGRFQKDPGMPSGHYIKTRTGKKVTKKKPPKSTK
jgi:hypothetical protein